tara:strand:- start:151 stop:729 length:579 start_codon:yes stop_codon:yes gene_type:complete
MYKVFDSKNEIIFTSQKLNNSSILVNNSSEIIAHNKVGKYLFNHLSSNPLKSIENWYSNYAFINAAGGLVENNGKFLWIFRNGLWDLPKGKLEKNEDFKSASLREVQEECGLDSNLVIAKLLYTSFHTYVLESKKILKKTCWFKMNYSGLNNLKPQISEGIEKVKWFDPKESSIKAENSFKSIKELWKIYLD